MTKRTLSSSPAGRIGLLLRHSDVSKVDLARTLELPDGLCGRYPYGRLRTIAYGSGGGRGAAGCSVTVLSGQVPINRHLGVSLRLGAVEAPDVPEDALEYADKLLRYKGLLDSWLGVLHSPLAGVGMSTDQFL